MYKQREREKKDVIIIQIRFLISNIVQLLNLKHYRQHIITWYKKYCAIKL